MKFFFVAATLTSLAAAPAGAATVFEGGTDFGADFATAFDIGPLGLGLTDVLGSLSIDPFGASDAVDTVKFTVQSGFELTEAAFQPLFFGSSTIEAVLADAAGATIASRVYAAFDGGSFLGGTTLGAGSYFFRLTAELDPSEVIFGSGYTTSLTTAEAAVTPPPNVIPLPASAPLALGALGIFGGLAWRKRRTG